MTLKLGSESIQTSSDVQKIVPVSKIENRETRTAFDVDSSDIRQKITEQIKQNVKRMSLMSKNQDITSNVSKERQGSNFKKSYRTALDVEKLSSKSKSPEIVTASNSEMISYKSKGSEMATLYMERFSTKSKTRDIKTPIDVKKANSPKPTKLGRTTDLDEKNISILKSEKQDIKINLDSRKSLVTKRAVIKTAINMKEINSKSKIPDTTTFSGGKIPATHDLILTVTEDSSTKNENQNNALMKQREKLPSIGPLHLTSLDAFLVKSKEDFEHLYHDRTVWDFKMSDFILIKKLGKGSFGKVYLAQFNQDNNLYAIKALDKKMVVKNQFVRYVCNEKRILQSMNFPFVMSLSYFFVDSNFLYFVLPFVPGGDFYDYLLKNKSVSEADAKFYIGQLVLALEYLHFLELIHRDIKPQNIMIDAFGYIKLVDFGLCIRCSSNDRTWTMTGTPEYMAPGIIAGQGYHNEVDWWALGVTTFETCAGRRPFRHKNIEKLYKLILAIKFKFPNHFSSHLKTFIRHLLVNTSHSKEILVPRGRALRIKSQPWLKDTDWSALLNRRIPAPYLPKLSEISTGNTL